MDNHQIGSSGGTDDSEHEQANAGDQGLAADTLREVADHDPAPNQHNANADREIATPIWSIRLWRIYLKWRDDPFRQRAHWSDLATIGLTVTLVAVGITQACIYYQQKKIMEGSSGQTDQLIKAANIQACAATKISAAADKFSASADKIREETTNAVGELKRAANDSETAMKQNSRNSQRALDVSIEASHLDERPWVVGQRFLLSNEPEETKI